MRHYYIVRDAARHWLVKYTETGCNSHVVETFTNAAAARAFARKKNKGL